MHEITRVLADITMNTIAKNHEFIRPTLVLLTNIASFNPTICRYIRQQVLPPLRDVHHRPEVGSSLRNKVVRLMTSVSDVSAVAAEFLFVLCNFNVNRLIKYTGFGNAAGLLSANGDENSDTEEYIAVKDKINPVLGCYEPDHPSSTEGMSEEQKEFEAMQLVNKIDKMMRQGIVLPGRIDKDGRVRPIEHILQLQESNKPEPIYFKCTLSVLSIVLALFLD
ncbi:Ric8 domain containing protein [Trichuris trichiura]|uniref:Ric8 domain containing protein n=1 Tax=Trichuris trichiura TaxID=36087 RepID=A0A077Z1K7_TRITR|nr:Ric8 domain containing protein [Trichuris trichiura]